MNTYSEITLYSSKNRTVTFILLEHQILDSATTHVLYRL